MALHPCRECGKEISDKALACPNCGVTRPSGSPASSAPSKTGARIVGSFVFAGLAAVVIGVISSNSNHTASSAGSISTTNSQPTNDAATVSPAQPAMPQDESAFIAAIDRGTAAYRGGANDMDKGASKPARAQEICAAIPSPDVEGWIGTVDQLSSNGDGKGVLTVRLAPHLTVGTTNNDFSDSIGMKTLIDPASLLFARARTMSVGEPVTFSGSFEPASADCYHEMSLTLEGSMEDPDFLMAFTALNER